VAYPDELLVEGERLLIHQHPHIKMLLIPAFMFLLTCGAGGYLVAVVGRQDWRVGGWSAIAVAAAMVLAWFVLAPLARWYNTHFVVTTRRVLVREGVLRRVGFEIPMNRIEGVSCWQGSLERLLGCGTLGIEPSGDSPLEFEDIPAVQRVCAVLRDATDRG